MRNALAFWGIHDLLIGAQVLTQFDMHVTTSLDVIGKDGSDPAETWL